MPDLRVVPTETREEQIEALANHLACSAEARREAAEHIIDGTGTLAAAGAEILRLRSLLDARRGNERTTEDA